MLTYSIEIERLTTVWQPPACTRTLDSNYVRHGIAGLFLKHEASVAVVRHHIHPIRFTILWKRWMMTFSLVCTFVPVEHPSRPMIWWWCLNEQQTIQFDMEMWENSMKFKMLVIGILSEEENDRKWGWHKQGNRKDEKQKKRNINQIENGFQKPVKDSVRLGNSARARVSLIN